VDVDQPLDPRPFAELVQRMAPALRGEGFRAAFQPILDSLGIERLPEQERSRVLALQKVDRDLVLAYWQGLLNTDPDVLREGNERLLRSLEAPFLGIFSRELDAADRAFMLDRLRDGSIEAWPGDRGHLFFLAEPERFAARLRAFAARVAVP
jgi:pimeloyl-ACP methyl ester carboxylesterase